MADDVAFRYIARIIGDTSPFRWELVKVDVTKSNKTTLSDKGEADTRENALADAADAAYEYERARRHKETREEVIVLEVPKPKEPTSHLELESIPTQGEETYSPPTASSAHELMDFMD